MNWRSDFPFFDKHNGFLDNASTTQKPRVVIDAMVQGYQDCAANVSRGIYQQAEQTTMRFEQARGKIAHFIGAQANELIITSGTTSGINMIAASLGLHYIRPGDEIIVSTMEHHSNLLPWQQVAQRLGARVHVIPLVPDGSLDVIAYEGMLSTRTKVVAITAVSNVLGTVNDLERIIRAAHAVGAYVVIDAAQAVGHQSIAVRAIDADFLIFSGHKMFGPTGVGGLFVKESLHDTFEPALVGGGMVVRFDWQKPEWVPMPRKCEAGTPPIIEVLGLARAAEYIQAIGFDAIRSHEQILMRRLVEGLQALPNVRLLGPIKQLMGHGHVLSFVVDGIHAHDVAAFLDKQPQRVAVSAGQHCASLVHTVLGITASVRVSVALYNTVQEIDDFLLGMQRLHS